LPRNLLNMKRQFRHIPASDSQRRRSVFLVPLFSTGLKEKTLLMLIRMLQHSLSRRPVQPLCIGRNGQLSLRHHSLHRISDCKLSALTTVHNFVMKNSDRTTAAERFFGSKPGNLFEFLINKIDLSGRPAQKRFQPKKEGYLQAA